MTPLSFIGLSGVIFVFDVNDRINFEASFLIVIFISLLGFFERSYPIFILRVFCFNIHNHALLVKVEGDASQRLLLRTRRSRNE